MTVAHLITDLAMGGTPRVLQSLVLGLRARGVRSHIYCLMERTRPSVADMLEPEGIPVTFFNIGLMKTPWVLIRLARCLKALRPNILHTWLYHANVLGRIAGRFAGVPHILSSERAIDPLKTALRVRLDRWTARWAERIIVNADAVREVLVSRERIAPDKIVVIPNGVDVGRFSPGDRRGAREKLGLPLEVPILVMVARLHPCKGHRVLLSALERLHVMKLFPLAIFIGDGPDAAALHAEVSARGLNKAVRFMGTQEDVIPILRAADIFLLPSLEEGMPGSVLEAMAVGLPVIATRVGGIPEITDDRCAILVQPGTVDELAEAMAYLLESPNRRADLGNWGRRMTQKTYSIEGMIRAHESLYRHFYCEDVG